MGHDHYHHHIPPQKNHALYFRVAHLGTVFTVATFILMWLSDSHTSFVSWLHAVADVGTIYLMACLARACAYYRITIAQFDKRVSRLNTLFLFLSAGIAWIEIELAERHAAALVMFGTGVVMFVGNYLQHNRMHEAHGHEKHEATGRSGFKTIDQHFIVDMIFDVGLIAAAVWIYFSFPGYEYADRYIAFGEALLLCGLGCRNLYDMYEGRSVHIG